MIRILLALLLVGLVSSQSDTCRYWCKTNKDQAYCCDRGDNYPPPTVHPGECPPVRPECPTTRIGAPRFCPHDGACVYSSKCCYDVCLEHHVCKPSQNVPISFPETPVTYVEEGGGTVY
ncbi:hypothetical protein SK128_027532 [Halocaridina rubra]|uniref:WAP domain-containing protein n=1 Tax=Halocaridina rubra TaxID=373956 RepID=A0AAN8WA89_HALRR